MKKEANLELIKLSIIFKDGTVKTLETTPDFPVVPVGVRYEGDDIDGNYPIWDGNSHNNLYGRVMTLLEATVENPTRLKAVKDLFSKELSEFSLALQRKANRVEANGNAQWPAEETI